MGPRPLLSENFLSSLASPKWFPMPTSSTGIHPKPTNTTKNKTPTHPGE